VWSGSYDFVLSQWGVGHGGFHSQSLVFQTRDREPTRDVGPPFNFRVVYDCGSGRTRTARPALMAAVNRMLSEVPDASVIDLLVVSHFDQDHVNGLALLSTEFQRHRITVGRIWAPVLTGIDALVVAARSAPEQRAGVAAFLADPSGTLATLFPGTEVLLLPPSTDAIPTIEPSNDSADPDPDPDPDPDADTEKDDSDGDEGAVEVTLVDEVAGAGLKIRAANIGRPAVDEPLWELQPYISESSLHGATNVQGVVSAKLGKPIHECTLADVLALMTDRAFMKQFNAAVKAHHAKAARGSRASSARTGPNLSTICLYSGPVSPYDWCRYRRGWDGIGVAPEAVPIAPSWLGTGDAGLAGAQHVDAMRDVLGQSRLDRVGVASVPHHGSRLDSGAPLWDALTSLRRVTIEAAHQVGGQGNHHPHAPVLRELRSRRLKVHVAVDRADFHSYDRRIR
jgi:hypothetical protein